MLIAVGIALVLFTWVALAALVVLTGLLPALLSHPGPVRWATIRRSIWWGVALSTLVVLISSLLVPLHSARFAVGYALVALFLGAGGLALGRSRGWRPLPRPGRGVWRLAVASLLAVVGLAAAALGPVTNYDTGLYHLGAIAYAADFSVIPGLANLYQPFGYASAQFPMAAALGAGPWGEDGFRLLNGFVIALVVLDLVLRFVGKRREPGTWIQLVSTAALLVSMVALADYWVTSPSQDASVFALTIIAVGYLADALTNQKRFVANGAVAMIVTITLVLIRPTMVFFAVGIASVLVLRWWSWRRTRPFDGFPVTSVLVGVFAVAAASVSTLRDYFLSGWFQYPLSLFAFDVPWRAGDPSGLREATLGYHRDAENLWESVSGYEWVGPWLSRAISQWETWLLVAMAAAAVIVLLVARRKGTVAWRSLVACMAPSALAVAAWFLISPPAYRFAWGPLVTLVAIPTGWALWRIDRTTASGAWSRLALSSFAIAVSAVVVFSLMARTPWPQINDKRQWQMGISIPYLVAPVPVVPVREVELASGLQIRVPVDGELCWTNFPLCTPRTADTLRLAGTNVQDGLVS